MLRHNYADFSVQKMPVSCQFWSLLFLHSTHHVQLKRTSGIHHLDSPLMCRSRRRRVLSQFDDLQQCYLRLRKAGKTAAPHLVPAGPSKHATQCPAAEDQPSVKRIKHEQPSQAHAEPPADSSAGPDPLSSGGTAEVTPADAPSSSVHPQVWLLCFWSASILRPSCVTLASTHDVCCMLSNVLQLFHRLLCILRLFRLCTRGACTAFGAPSCRA